MTVEEYRQRMIKAFHNADCDELIAICALPTEKEFEHLEWLLKNHYKREPCEDDCISRQAVLDKAFEIKTGEYTSAMVVYAHDIRILPPVTPQPKTGHWIINEDEENTVHGHCSVCGWEAHYYEDDIIGMSYCPNCGAKMVEPQERSDKE